MPQRVVHVRYAAALLAGVFGFPVGYLLSGIAGSWLGGQAALAIPFVVGLMAAGFGIAGSHRMGPRLIAGTSASVFVWWVLVAVMENTGVDVWGGWAWLIAVCGMTAAALGAGVLVARARGGTP